MSGTCAGWAGGAACCLPVGAGPFCPNGLSWPITVSAEQSRVTARQVRSNPNSMRALREYLIVAPAIRLWLGGGRRLRHAQLRQQERPIEGHLVDAIVTATGSPVP